MTAPDRIWINLDASWDGMVSDRHGTAGLPCYHHQRVVDELAQALQAALDYFDHHGVTGGSIPSARAALARYRGGV